MNNRTIAQVSSLLGLFASVFLLLSANLAGSDAGTVRFIRSLFIRALFIRLFICWRTQHEPDAGTVRRRLGKEETFLFVCLRRGTIPFFSFFSLFSPFFSFFSLFFSPQATPSTSLAAR